jgi:hypothetical protein
MKLTIESIREEFIKHGYELLEEVYISYDHKYKYRCPNHPEKELAITYSHLKEGKGCPYCSKVGRASFEEVKKAFQDQNYILNETEYKITTTQMSFTCKKHPEKKQSISYVCLLQAKHGGCQYCGTEATASKLRFPVEEIKQAFIDIDCELIGEYKNDRTPLKFKCHKHPDFVFEMTYSALKRGKICPVCAFDSNIRQQYVSIEAVKCIFNQRGYKLLSNIYKNQREPLEYICLKHPNKIQYTSLAILKMGHGCRLCANEKLSGKNHYRWKGGISVFCIYLRAYLFDWKRQILKKYNYKCVLSNGTIKEKLHIHHLVPFYQVVDKIIEELNLPIYKTIIEYTKEQLDMAIDKLQNYHNDIPGVPLVESLHKLFHHLYGNDACPENFYEFKERWNSGEFENLII